MILYLSGPMQSYEDMNYPEFNRIDKVLTDAGHTIINPAKNSKNRPEYGTIKWDWKVAITGDIRDEMLSRDLPVLDGIVMLPGWERSKGLKVEVFNGLYIHGAAIYMYREMKFKSGIKFELVPVEVSFDMNIKVKV